MNLYATTTSERASKGQGGNNFLDIQVHVHDKTKVAYDIFIKDIPEQGKTVFQVYENHFGKHKILEKIHLYEIKGKRQKGECLHQDSGYHSIGKFICNECRTIFDTN